MFEKGDGGEVWVCFAFLTQITRWFGDRSVNKLYVAKWDVCVYVHLPTSVLVFDVDMGGLLNRPTGHMARGSRGGS